MPKIKFGGWPNREGLVLWPSQPSWSSNCPCRHDSCTLKRYRQPHAGTGIQAQDGKDMHTCMHKPTRALERATASACPHASTCAHACTTHTQTHINTHSLSLTHIHTPTHAHTHTHTHTCKHALYMSAHVHANIYTRASAGQLLTGVGAGMAKINLARIRGYPGSLLI